jgi:hypothetical protein
MLFSSEEITCNHLEDEPLPSTFFEQVEEREEAFFICIECYFFYFPLLD